MLMPGCVVMFHSPAGVIQYGQVVRMEQCEIEIKIINKLEFAVIRNWCKACLSGNLTVVLPAVSDNMKKTISITLSESERLPNMIDRIRAFLNGCRFVLDRKINVWFLKTLASGTLYIDGWFIPFSGQHIIEPIYFEYHNKVKDWINKERCSIPCIINK